MIIFDLDGTLANCEHRRHFVERDKASELWKPDWKSFFQACDMDESIENVCQIFRYLNHDDIDIEIWSARCECVRSKTEYWINNYIIPFSWNSKKLKMRPIGDFTSDDELKEKWLDETITDGKKIDFVFDDRPKVVRMWRRRGIFVFDCNQTEKEF